MSRGTRGLRTLVPDGVGAYWWMDDSRPLPPVEATAIESKEAAVTLVWFIVWIIADRTGSRAPLLTDPVNAWTWTLILAVALDLARQHAPERGRVRAGRDKGG